MKFDIEHRVDQVTVSEDGSVLLKIYLVDYIQGDTLVKKLSVGLSSCLVGGFDDAEAQVRAYLAAFELARKVLKPEEVTPCQR